MSQDKEEPGGGRFHTVQPLRDLESNWTVDLAKNLEEYLRKICSGEISGEDSSPLSVNFAEAALLLQGSIQVYSRKVEYLYSLVLHALEFISNNRQHVQPEGASAQENENSTQTVPDEENDNFWDLEDIPVDAKNSLDIPIGREDALNHFVKPPANLVVLEGDCGEASGDCGELETYLLSTSNLYREFIILEPCNAAAVDDFLKDDPKAGRDKNGSCRRTPYSNKSRKTLNSPLNQSGGTVRRPSAGKNKNVNPDQSPIIEKLNPNDSCVRNDAVVFGENIHEFEVDNGYAEPGESDVSDDENDPWKPLNPHEPGNLKLKPFKKVIASQRRRTATSSKLHHLHTEFPPAKLHGTISPEFVEIFETQSRASDRQDVNQTLPYEKLRQSLVDGGNDNDLFHHQKDQNDVDDNNDQGDFNYDLPDFEIPGDAFECGGDAPIQAEQHDDGAFNQDACGQEGPSSQASLEDLCRSHLDSLLASIAESEQQTELATRVSTWKQRIEQNLEEQELRPEFDIHEYGERILDKLSSQGENTVLSYGDIVRGQEKHDVARTFSALLQLVELELEDQFQILCLFDVLKQGIGVNNRNVDLEKNADGANGGAICYKASNPFRVRLLNHVKRQVVLLSSKKRINSPVEKRGSKARNTKLSRKEKNTAASSSPSEANCDFAVNLGNSNGIRCTPDRKRRRKSQLVQPIDIQSQSPHFA